MAKSSLNPCFNGIYSMRAGGAFIELQAASLNPCFNGICSMSTLEREY